METGRGVESGRGSDSQDAKEKRAQRVKPVGKQNKQLIKSQQKVYEVQSEIRNQEMNIWKQQRKELLDHVASRQVRQRRRGGKKEGDKDGGSDEDSDDSLRAGKQLQEDSDENRFDSDSFDMAG